MVWNFWGIFILRGFWTIFYSRGILNLDFNPHATIHGNLILRSDQNTIICDILIARLCERVTRCAWVSNISGIFIIFQAKARNLKASLKSDFHLPKKNCVICLLESPLKIAKNAFYFILEALFVLKIFKLLSWLFGHVGKTAWLER